MIVDLHVKGYFNSVQYATAAVARHHSLVSMAIPPVCRYNTVAGFALFNMVSFISSPVLSGFSLNYTGTLSCYAMDELRVPK